MRLGALAALVGVLVAGWLTFRHLSAANPGRAAPALPAVAVTVATARVESWQRRVETVGTLAARHGVDVANELGGTVVTIGFESGTAVEAGDLLVQLDASREEADLRAIETRLEQARSERARAEELRRGRTIAEQTLEQRITEVRNFEAQAASQRAIIAKKRIVAPFDGALGIRRVDLGAYLEPGTTIVTLQQLTPIFVDFDVPEHRIGVVAPGYGVAIRVPAYPDETFTGEVTAVSPRVDPATGSFAVQATLPNREQRLRPGMFADVTLEVPGSRQVVAIPEPAVSFHAWGETVFVVREPETPAGGDGALVARQAIVETGERRALAIEVIAGVEPGERVVTAGQLKLVDGAPVRISHVDVLDDVAPRPVAP